jgi:nucleotide-binding universal stress UspA family protein
MTAPEQETVRHATPDEPEAILVAVDSSSGVERIINMAVRLGRSMPDATIHILHVFRQSRLDRARAGAPPPPSSDAIEDAKEYLAHCAKDLRRKTRATVVQHFVLGDVATEILRLTKELDIDMLVVGTHDYVGFERFLLGSVAESLMRKVGCPVFCNGERGRAVACPPVPSSSGVAVPGTAHA